MAVELRPVTAGELPAVARSAAVVFADPVPDEAALARMAQTVELDRTLAGFDGGRVVATSVTNSFRLSVPGAVLPAGGLAGVTVAPTHRRRGILRDLVRHHLEDGRARGEPLACLWASEATIYGRFGYGVATRALRWELHRRYGVFCDALGERARAAAERVEPLDSQADASEIVGQVRPVHDRMLGVVPGVIERTDTYWVHRAAKASTGLRWVVIDGDAYASYRVLPGHNETGSEHTLAISELVACTTDAYAGLFRYLLDHDLVGPVTGLMRPVDEPLPMMLADGRRLVATLMEGMWLRILDVRAALERRAYQQEGRLVLEVVDPFPPSRMRVILDAGPDGASCRIGSDSADLTVGSAALAAAYLGETRITDLVHAGLADEHRAGAASNASRLFAWDPKPWAPTAF